MRTGLALMLVVALFVLGPVAVAQDAPAGGADAAAKPAPKPAPKPPEAAAPAATKDAGKSAADMRGKITVKKIFQWAGIIGWIIVGLFIIGVGWLFLCLFRIRAGVIMPKRAIRQIDALFGEKKIRDALEFCKKDGSVLARMIGAALSEIRGGYGEMQQVMGEIGDEESIRQHQTVGMFALIAGVAPLFGLLGTVWGMILTFNQIASSPDAVAKPADMAASIQQALVTTCFGLIAAIPNVFFFTVFRNRVVNLMIEVSTVADDLMVRFKGLQPSTARSAAAPPKAVKPAAQAKAPEKAELKPKEAEKPEEKPEPAEEAAVAVAEESEAAEDKAEPKEAPEAEPPAESAEKEGAAQEEPIEVSEEAVKVSKEADAEDADEGEKEEPAPEDGEEKSDRK